MHPVISGIVIFFCALAIDFFYTKWIRFVGEDRPVEAALSSMCIGGCGLIGITGVVHDYWLAVPYLIGLGFGTMLGMQR